MPSAATMDKKPNEKGIPMSDAWDKLVTRPKPTRCSKCGSPLQFKGRGTYECEKCGATEYDEFGLINRFLEEHGPSPAPVISRALGIPIAQVKELISQGRLEPIPGSEERLYKDLTPQESAPATKGTLAAPKESASGKMRFAGDPHGKK